MFENVKIPIDHHAIFLFCQLQNLLILSHLSESVDDGSASGESWRARERQNGTFRERG